MRPCEVQSRFLRVSFRARLKDIEKYFKIYMQRFGEIFVSGDSGTSLQRVM